MEYIVAIWNGFARVRRNVIKAKQNIIIWSAIVYCSTIAWKQ